MLQRRPPSVRRQPLVPIASICVSFTLLPVSCVSQQGAEGFGVRSVAFGACQPEGHSSSPGGFEGADECLDPLQAVEWPADVTGVVRVGLRRKHTSVQVGRHSHFAGNVALEYTEVNLKVRHERHFGNLMRMQ